MIKVICVGGGKAKSVPEVRPPRPERVPTFDDLVELTRLVGAYRDYAQAVECMDGFKLKNWRRIVNNSQVKANKLHQELDKGFKKWYRLG